MRNCSIVSVEKIQGAKVSKGDTIAWVQKVEGLEMVKTEAKKIVAKAKKAVKEAMQTVDTEVKKTTKSAWKSRKNIEMD